jgi:hypothetical protein
MVMLREDYDGGERGSVRVRKRVCAPPQEREAGGSAARDRKKGQAVGLHRDSSAPSPSRP